MSSGQLPLWSPKANPSRFENFSVHEESSNYALLKSLQAYIHNPETTPFYIHGEAGSGKTHLLHSAANLIRELNGEAVMYFDCESISMSPEILLGEFNSTNFLLDNIDFWSQNKQGEQSLFNIVEQAKSNQFRLILTAQQSPKNSRFDLADLISRLGSGVVFQLEPLDESGKVQALQKNIKARNLHIDDKVLRYLLTHFARDNHSVFAALETLDRASMVEQRRLTIPFVQKVLSLT